MSKYEDLLKDIFSVFDSAAWKAENIKTYPSNFLAVNAGSEFIRVSIIPGGRGLNVVSVSGVLIIDIFTATGNGPKRAFVIADKLDAYLAAKSLKTDLNASLQFSGSSLGLQAVDPDNPALSRVVYTLPFNYFGVF
jgi:hypothetical protein